MKKTTDARTEVSRLLDEGASTEMNVGGLPVHLESYSISRRKGRKPSYRLRLMASSELQDLDIFFSPTGQSVRVFRNGTELT